VNNDGELAVDISESDEMEELLQKEIEVRGVDCEEARNREERLMLDDATSWVNAGRLGESVHPKTGAASLHVAAAKGYVRVINLLVKAGAQVNAQDFDGWTPLHAAAHWGQGEACRILAENYANMDIKNYVGQTCFDVADPEVLRLLDELKKRQATMQKDKPEIRNLINRPAVPAERTVAAINAATGNAPHIAAGKRRCVVLLDTYQLCSIGDGMSIS
jgi:protein phosphatase 1 regulatory subunit 12A